MKSIFLAAILTAISAVAFANNEPGHFACTSTELPQETFYFDSRAGVIGMTLASAPSEEKLFAVPEDNGPWQTFIGKKMYLFLYKQRQFQGGALLIDGKRLNLECDFQD